MSFSSIIVEDLLPAAELLKKFCQRSGIIAVRGQFPNAEEALVFLRENTVDIIFLDVEMPGISGIQLLDRLQGSPQVILTTSKTEYAYDAFQYNVTDYLKKPFTYTRFLDAIQKVRAGKGQADPAAAGDHIFIKVDGRLIRLNSEEVLYVESMGDYVKFVTSEKKYITHNTIKNIELKLDAERFMKVHRSFIVNISRVQDVQDGVVRINGTLIPVSKAHKSRVREHINII